MLFPDPNLSEYFLSNPNLSESESLFFRSKGFVAESGNNGSERIQIFSIWILCHSNLCNPDPEEFETDYSVCMVAVVACGLQ